MPTGDRAVMGAASTPARQWRYGPIQVASLPYLPGQRGEPQVRDTLARWLGEPGTPPLARDPSGRPRLLAPHQDHDTGWSHSGEQLLLALGRGVTLGVDLERLMAARVPLQAGLPGEPVYGMTPEAGLPKGWVQC